MIYVFTFIRGSILPLPHTIPTGTYVLELLADHYPEVYRFATPVCPSEDDDVITSPYNAVLAMKQLTEHADCVLPVENQALFDICQHINKGADIARRHGAVVTDGSGGVRYVRHYLKDDLIIIIDNVGVVVLAQIIFLMSYVSVDR